jgi:hypothetical protein
MNPETVVPPLHRRVLDTFISPGRMFAGFGDNPPWAGALAIAVVLGAAAVLLIPEQVFIDQMENAMSRRGEPVTIDSDAATIAKFGRIMGAIGALIVQPVVTFGIAGALTLVFSLILGGRATYRQHLAVVAHALLITTAGALLALGLGATFGQVVHFSLALAVPFLEEGTYLYRVLEGIDVFALWMVSVMGLGVSVLDDRRSWASAAGILLGVFLAIRLIVASFGA